MKTGKKSLFFCCGNWGSFLVAGFSVIFSVPERVHRSWEQYQNHFSVLSLAPGQDSWVFFPASWTPSALCCPSGGGEEEAEG